MIGEAISHYRILSKLGAGGMSEAYGCFSGNNRKAVSPLRLPPQIRIETRADALPNNIPAATNAAAPPRSRG